VKEDLQGWGKKHNFAVGEDYLGVTAGTAGKSDLWIGVGREAQLSGEGAGGGGYCVTLWQNVKPETVVGPIG